MAAAEKTMAKKVPSEGMSAVMLIVEMMVWDCVGERVRTA
jgi:hypothetical protein